MATHVLKKTAFAHPPLQRQKHTGQPPKTIEQAYRRQAGMGRPAQSSEAQP